MVRCRIPLLTSPLPSQALTDADVRVVVAAVSCLSGVAAQLRQRALLAAAERVRRRGASV
jgi:hypothetical protein